MPDIADIPPPDKLPFRDSEWRICARCGSPFDVEQFAFYALKPNGAPRSWKSLWLCPKHQPRPPPPAPAPLNQRVAAALAWARQEIDRYNGGNDA